MADAWFIQRPVRPVWPVRGLYRPPRTTSVPRHLDPSNRLATIHTPKLQADKQDRQTGQAEQRFRSIGRTVTCNGRPKTGTKLGGHTKRRQDDGTTSPSTVLSCSQRTKTQHCSLLWSSYGIGQTIIFSSCRLFFFLLSIFVSIFLA